MLGVWVQLSDIAAQQATLLAALLGWWAARLFIRLILKRGS